MKKVTELGYATHWAKNSQTQPRIVCSQLFMNHDNQTKYLVFLSLIAQMVTTLPLFWT